MRVYTCPRCGTIGAMPENIIEGSTPDESEGLHCPWGHLIEFPDGPEERKKDRVEVVKLRHELEQLEARLTAANERLMKPPADPCGVVEAPPVRLYHDAQDKARFGCPYCEKSYSSEAGLAVHCCRNHAGHPAPDLKINGGAA